MPDTLADLRASIRAGGQAYIDLALGTVTSTAIVPPSDADRDAWIDIVVGETMDYLGLPRASFAAVIDDDIAAVPDAAVPRLRDEALLEAYRKLIGRLILFDQSQGNNKQSLSVLKADLRDAIADLAGKIRTRYGPSRPAAAGSGTMTSAPDRQPGGLRPNAYAPPCGWRFP